MRIAVRISVPREVLGHGEHAACLQPAPVGHRLFGHLLRVFTEGADMYHRVQRIGVYIYHGGKVHHHAQLTQLACHFAAVCLYQAIIGNTSQSRIPRERGHVFQPHGRSPFAVEGYHQRHLGVALGQVGQDGLFFGRTHSEEQAAYLVFLHQFFYRLLVLLGFFRHDFWHQQLAHFLVQAHAREHRVDPLPACPVGRRGQVAGTVGLCLRRQGGKHEQGYYTEKCCTFHDISPLLSFFTVV